VYVMSSLLRTLYTGVTNDLERRVTEYKEGKPDSFTATRTGKEPGFYARHAWNDS